MTGALQAPADYAADPESYYKVECHPEGWPYLHELQDANASIARLKAGLTSRKRILSEEGIDVREVDQENAEDKKRAQDLGLKYEGETAADPGPPPEQRDDDDRNAAAGY
jgi:capsid protein